ncbi:MAG: hypothetical protein U9R21_09580 [Candidatus Thermoplasmatota archaeon]|nr:hypothetical protein [Candidatus Thermoplasmatota archaeon]
MAAEENLKKVHHILSKDKRDIAHILLNRANISIPDYLEQLLRIKKNLKK